MLDLLGFPDGSLSIGLQVGKRYRAGLHSRILGWNLKKNKQKPHQHTPAPRKPEPGALCSAPCGTVQGAPSLCGLCFPWGHRGGSEWPYLTAGGANPTCFFFAALLWAANANKSRR